MMGPQSSSTRDRIGDPTVSMNNKAEFGDRNLVSKRPTQAIARDRVGFVSRKFRLIFLRNPNDVQVRFVENSVVRVIVTPVEWVIARFGLYSSLTSLVK